MIKTNFGECTIVLQGNKSEPTLTGFVQIENGYILLHSVDDNNGLTDITMYPFNTVESIHKLGTVTGEKVQ